MRDWSLLLMGFLCGAGLMAYFTSTKFRDHVNEGVKGLWAALKGFARGSGKRQVKPKATPVQSSNGKAKLQKCLSCGDFSPQKEMQEARLENGRVAGWIHPECVDNLPENVTTTDYR